jgi:lisH domain-containing protein FOPNL
MKGDIRSELFRLVTGDSRVPASESTRDKFIINELIREYMQFNGYTNSLSVFLRETGQPEEPMNHEFLAQSIDVAAHKMIPILYTLTAVDQNLSERASQEDHPRIVEERDSGFFEITTS